MRKSAPSTHGQFFNSLKQLEKRLKLENPSSPPTTDSLPPPPPPPPSIHIENQVNTNTTQQTDSLGTPIYLNDNNPNNTTSSTLQESETPREFLSSSPNFALIQNSPLQVNQTETEEIDEHDKIRDLDDEIELLMQLLGLSDPEEPQNMMGRFGVNGDDGFYERIVGVKGPKNGKEVDRLEGWIKHYLNGEKKEPLRLAHLLLGKAAFLNSCDDFDGFGGIEFPDTIDEFLQNDPPSD